MTVDRALGIAMTEKIMAAVKPIVDGQDIELVIESMAAAMMAALTAAQVDVKMARLVLHRYAERILDFAADID